MAADVTAARVKPSPTAVVAETVTWEDFPVLWRTMLDEVWAFLRGGGAPAGLYSGGHNVMVYLDDVPHVEVGVQVNGPFEPAGRVVPSALPGGLVAASVHDGPVADLGDTHRAVRDWSDAHGYRLTGPHWEVYGDPDLATGHFPVTVCWSIDRHA